MSKQITKRQRIIDFVKEGGVEGRTFSECQEFICKVNGRDWNLFRQEKNWNTDEMVFRRVNRGYYCTGLRGWNRPILDGTVIIKDSFTGRWVHSDNLKESVPPTMVTTFIFNGEPVIITGGVFPSADFMTCRVITQVRITFENGNSKDVDFESLLQLEDAREFTFKG